MAKKPIFQIGAYDGVKFIPFTWGNLKILTENHVKFPDDVSIRHPVELTEKELKEYKIMFTKPKSSSDPNPKPNFVEKFVRFIFIKEDSNGTVKENA